MWSCTEIFYDQQQEIDGERYLDLPPPKKVEATTEECRFLEIWNLVFMQYQCDEAGKLERLKRPCVDTGSAPPPPSPPF